MKRFILRGSLASFLVLLFVNVTGSWADTGSVYSTFLECFKNHSQPSHQVSKLVYEQTNSSFTSVLQSYLRNARFSSSSTPKPLLIVTPTQESHVQATVLCARDSAVQVTIRSGGHDFEGLSYVSNDPFLILDMSNMRSVDVNIQDETAWIQAGSILGEVYYGIGQKSKVHGFPAGVCTTVGVGGHLSGGGYGNMIRKYGLSIDNVLDAKIVDANGRVLDRKSMGEDLFWAIRGGGGASFGVVLAYKIKLVPVPETVTVFHVEKTLDENVTDLVYQWQHVAPKIDNDLFMRVSLHPVASQKQGQKTIGASMNALFLGDADRLVSLLNKEFPELGLKKENCMELSWIQSVLWWDISDNIADPKSMLNRFPGTKSYKKRKSDYVVTPISKADLEFLWKKMITLDKCSMSFSPYGGRMDEIPATATAFPHRAGNLFKIEYAVNWRTDDTETERTNLAQIRELYSFMTKFVSKNPRRAYLNYRDLDIGTTTNGNNSFAEGKVYGVKYFHNNLARLVKAKTAADPQNFFRNVQSIPTLPRKSR